MKTNCLKSERVWKLYYKEKAPDHSVNDKIEEP